MQAIFIGCATCEHNTSLAHATLAPRLAERGVITSYQELERWSSSATTTIGSQFQVALVLIDHSAPEDKERVLLAALRDFVASGRWVLLLHSTAAAFHRSSFSKVATAECSLHWRCDRSPMDAWGAFVGGRYLGKAWQVPGGPPYRKGGHTCSRVKQCSDALAANVAPGVEPPQACAGPASAGASAHPLLRSLSGATHIRGYEGALSP